MGGDDIRGVQLAGCCKHTVGFCDDGDKTGGADGGAGGAGERMVGQLEQRAEAISREFNSQDVANTLWAFSTMGTMLVQFGILGLAQRMDKESFIG